MFDLDRAVDQWSDEIGSSCFSQQGQLDELKDHLYSEVTRLKGEGLSAEQAFAKATERLGDADALKAEFAKNDGVMAKLFSAEKKLQETINAKGFSKRTVAAMRIGHALFFAFAMLASSWIIARGGGDAGTVLMLIVALWFATSLFIPNTYLQCEVEYFKKRFDQMRKARLG